MATDDTSPAGQGDNAEFLAGGHTAVPWLRVRHVLQCIGCSDAESHTTAGRVAEDDRFTYPGGAVRAPNPDNADGVSAGRIRIGTAGQRTGGADPAGRRHADHCRRHPSNAPVWPHRQTANGFIRLSLFVMYLLSNGARCALLNLFIRI